MSMQDDEPFRHGVPADELLSCAFPPSGFSDRAGGVEIYPASQSEDSRPPFLRWLARLTHGRCDRNGPAGLAPEKAPPEDWPAFDQPARGTGEGAYPHGVYALAHSPLEHASPARFPVLCFHDHDHAALRG